LFTLAAAQAAEAHIASFVVRPLDPVNHLESIEPGLKTSDYWITVSWRADRTLKRGYHYEGELVSSKQVGRCVALARSSSYAQPPKGKQMSLSFRDFHFEDEVNYLEWCKGATTVTIRIARNGAKVGTGTTIGTTRFSFAPSVDYESTTQGP
jgi:hypothetical protein